MASVYYFCIMLFCLKCTAVGCELPSLDFQDTQCSREKSRFTNRYMTNFRCKEKLLLYNSEPASKLRHTGQKTTLYKNQKQTHNQTLTFCQGNAAAAAALFKLIKKIKLSISASTLQKSYIFI